MVCLTLNLPASRPSWFSAAKDVKVAVEGITVAPSVKLFFFHCFGNVGEDAYLVPSVGQGVNWVFARYVADVYDGEGGVQFAREGCAVHSVSNNVDGNVRGFA